MPLSDVTAMAFSLPAATCGRTAVTVSMISGTCPPIVSVIAVAEPLYGMPNSGAWLCAFSNSNTMRAVVLGIAMSADFGADFAAATMSATELPANDGLAAMAIGNEPMRMTGSKSFSASNGSVS